MKEKIKSEFLNFKAVLNNNLIIFLLILLAVVTFSNVVMSYKFGAIQTLYFFITIEVISLFLLTFYLINLRVSSTISNSSEILDRFNKKIDYFKYSIKRMFLYNLIIFIATILLIVIFSLIFCNGIGNINHSFYDISAILYLLFHFTRIFLILFIISLICVFIYRTFKNKVFMALPIVLIGLMYSKEGFLGVVEVNSILDMKLLFYDYFDIYKYASFYLEISLSYIYIIVSWNIINYIKYFN